MVGARSRVRHEKLINFIGQYVHDHVDGALSTELLARESGFSRFHLNRVFHAHTGFQLGEYIQRRRMERAYTLLKDTRMSVIEVALCVGYESHSAFSRAFFKAFGRQPSRVRDARLPIRGGFVPGFRHFPPAPGSVVPTGMCA